MIRFARVSVPMMLTALVAAGCGSDRADDESTAEPASTENVPDTSPTLEPGGVAIGTVTIGDVVVDYVSAVPAGFEIGDSAPLLLAFPPGGQNLVVTERLVEQTYAEQALERGWVVVSPAAPGGTLFFQGSETIVPAFLDWVETWVEPEDGAPHVAGVSNGGISSFRFAAENGDRVRSIVVFPGFPRSEADREALASLTAVPIRMFVGGNDLDWIGPAEEAVESFRSAGGNIELTIFPGESHIIQSTADGSLIFDQLDSFRS